MSKCDTIKAFFMSFRRIEQRIMARMDEHDRYYELATRITPSYTDLPSGNGGVSSRVENGAILMRNILDELDQEVAELREYRRLARKIIDMLGDQRYADVLALRYFNGCSWDEIGKSLNYDRTHVWRIHGRALAAADRVMQTLAEDDARAQEIYERISSEAERCNKMQHRIVI